MEKSMVNESVVKSREIHGKTRWLLRLQWKNQGNPWFMKWNPEIYQKLMIYGSMFPVNQW